MRRVIAQATVALVTISGTWLPGLVAPGGAKAKVPGANGQIVFARFKPPLDDTATFTVNPDGTHQHRLFPGASGFPHWSPDGSRVAILTCLNPPTCNTAAAIVDPDTGTVRGLTMPDPTLFTACVVWAPNAKRLACESFDESDPRRNGIYTIRTSDGHGLRRITSIPGGGDMPGDYSPDGTQIVFLRTKPTRPSRANQALFIAELDGSSPRRITPWGLSEEPGSWSPDGTKILFAGGGSLFVVGVDGTGLAEIALQTDGSSSAFDPGWSPDGTKIVFALFSATGPEAGQSDIYTADADGTDLQQVTNDSTSEHFPDWGPHPLAT